MKRFKVECFATVVFTILISFNVRSQDPIFTWIGGDNSRNIQGLYGEIGYPDPLNFPGARAFASSWTDSNNNFWLFGGEGFDDNSGAGELNDLWKYDVISNQWTWIKGSSSSFEPGIYRTRGVESSDASPGGRFGSATWVDKDGNLWLFGGQGTGRPTYPRSSGYLNDLWKFNIETNNWTWVGGTNQIGQNGIYGTKGISSTANMPGARVNATTWRDKEGNFWLLGGIGFSKSGTTSSVLNDLWKYEPKINLWTWVGGTELDWQRAVYGTQGLFSDFATPGSRFSSCGCSDSNDNFWLFGGYGTDLLGNEGGLLNDLWKFDKTKLQWSWIAGTPAINMPGTFGLKGESSINNSPGSRVHTVCWTDQRGDLYLLGGLGLDKNGQYGLLNDLWKYDTTNGVWLWLGGSERSNEIGSFSDKGVISELNKISGRKGSCIWTGSDGRIWIFGGFGLDKYGDEGRLNDLWQISFKRSGQSITFNFGFNEIKYGDSPIELDAISSSGLPIKYISSNELVVKIDGSKAVIHGAGNAIITAYQEGDYYYSPASPVSQSITIKKLTLQVKSEASQRTYGEQNPLFILSYSGFKNGENFSVLDTSPSASTTAVKESNAGTYPITISGGSDNNYDFTYAEGTLTVNKASLTAKADNKSRIYGDPNPEFTFTYSGFKNTDTEAVLDAKPTATTEANLNSNTGSYPISLSGGSDGNYALTLVNGTLTIDKAELQVRAEDKVRIYGDQNPVLTYTYAEFRNNDEAKVIDAPPVAETNANLSSNTGTYPINLSAGSDNNYRFTFTPGKLTVNKAPLSATADNKSRGYGEENPELSITYSGLKNNESASVLDTAPTAFTTASIISNTGTFPITLTGGSDNNYSLTLNQGSLTVNKAILIAKADDKTRPYNTDNPELTITYTGLKNNETATVLDKTPAVSTTAVKISLPGGYAITASGGIDNNYSLTYQDGALNVTKLTQTISFTIPQVLYEDQSPYTLTATSSSGLPIAFSVLEGNVTIVGNQLNINGPGAIKIKALQEGSNIYQSAEMISVSTVSPSFTVSGFISKPGNIPLIFGLTKLFYENGSLAKSGSVTNGTYSIPLVRPGKYILQIIPFGNDDSQVLPAYFEAALLSKDATVVIIDGNTSLSMELPSKPEAEKGKGEINGRVIEGNSSAGRFVVGRMASGNGIPSIPVYLIETPSTLIKRTATTDKDGLFKMAEVPNGTYRIGLDLIGSALDKTSTNISITPENPLLEVSAVISNNTLGQPVVSLVVEVITSLSNEKLDFNVYPNPTVGDLIIRYKSQSKDEIRIELIDLNGHSINRISVGHNDEGIYFMPLAHLNLAGGIYLLQVKQGTIIHSVKILRN